MDGPACVADSLLLFTLKVLWGLQAGFRVGIWRSQGGTGKPMVLEQSPLPSSTQTHTLGQAAPGQARKPTFTMSSLMFLGSRFTRSISLK